MILNTYFQQYKPFLSFLGKFFLSYLVLAFMYRVYLDTIPDDLVDGITANVSKLVMKFAEWLGISIETKLGYMDYNIIYKGKIVARIIEGCNAASVIILFIAFIIAFSGKLKSTLLYVLMGSFIIYVLNVFRIIFLTVLMFHFPAQEHLLHGVLFPLFIYGVVFLLWVIWVKKVFRYASK